VIKIAEAEKTSDTPIPPLRRPLGVPDVPTTKTKTLSERSADFLNQEKQLEKRRHLYVANSTWNGVDDLIRLQSQGGVDWVLL
jgi:ATPase complex subunit ATP10